MPTLPQNIVPVGMSGTLSDSQIRLACQSNWLISEHFNEASIRQACYELRASHTYFELDPVDANTIPKKHELLPGGYILIKPKQIITIITEEALKLPDDVLGRVLTKGQLFSIGIVPVNTYADPGFRGPLGITLANFSNNHLRIVPGAAIAKIEFSKLSEPVEEPYRGQHGYRDQIWPVPYDMIIGKHFLSADGRVGGYFDELKISHGDVIAAIARKVFKYHAWLVYVAVLYFVLTTGLIAYLGSSNRDAASLWLVGIAINVVSSIVVSAITAIATTLRR